MKIYLLNLSILSLHELFRINPTFFYFEAVNGLLYGVLMGLLLIEIDL